jgi:hypothetical protein
MSVLIVLGIIAAAAIVVLVAMSRDFEQPIWEIFGKSKR